MGYTVPRSMLNSYRFTIVFFAIFKSLGAMLSGPIDFFSWLTFSRTESCDIFVVVVGIVVFQEYIHRRQVFGRFLIKLFPIVSKNVFILQDFSPSSSIKVPSSLCKSPIFLRTVGFVALLSKFQYALVVLTS